MAQLVIFGTGQLAQTVSVYLEHHGDHEIAGYTVDAAHRGGQETCRGRPVYDWETLEDHFAPGDGLLFGPVSFRGMNAFRRDRYLEGKRRGYGFASFIHPASHVYAEQIGENCLILEANTVQPFVRIGDNVVLWSGNHIGHHTVIGDHCFFTSHVGISGACTIGPGCFFAGKSGVADNVTVGEGCLVGAGALILRDLEAGSFAREESPRIVPGAARRFARLLLG